MSEIVASWFLNGRELDSVAGESLLEAARRAGVEIPTLCHDPRLQPVGACRSCLVEVEGRPRLIPACTTAPRSGMRVLTDSPRVQRHRRILFSLYLADHPRADTDPRGDPAPLPRMAAEFGADPSWPKLPSRRAGRPGDPNPYLSFDPTACILCARCVRYCEEVEAVEALALCGRGPETTIGTAGGRGLLDTSCELCGGCIDTCPTGALYERMPLALDAPPPSRLRKVRTTCNYCGVGCQLDLNVNPAGAGGRGEVVMVTSPPPGTPPNDGNLCVKGRFAYDFIGHSDRLDAAYVRDEGGALRRVPLEEAIRRAAEGLRTVAARHGADALGFVSSSRCTVEENYLVQKLARAAFMTHNVQHRAAT